LDEASPQTNSKVNCADQWKNAGPERHKQMLNLFDETGIFIAACRHRTVLYACDMIRSGELLCLFSLFKIYTFVSETRRYPHCYSHECATFTHPHGNTANALANSDGMRFLLQWVLVHWSKSSG
jgi:hypothetical protein